MKQLILLLFAISFFGCNKISIDLTGKHELRKFNTHIDNRLYTSYFLFFGSSSHSTYESVRFYWKDKDNEYICQEEDYSNISLMIDSTAVVPYVTFAPTIVSRDKLDGWTKYKLYAYGIDHVIIHCKESDFQMDNNINDLK